MFAMPPAVSFARPARLRSVRAGLLVLALSCAAASFAQEMSIKLSGREEVPPVTTAASGSGSFKVNPDRSITGSVKTTGMQGTMAHIHEGPAGKNGPVAIPLEKGAQDGEWRVPAGTMLSPAQLEALKAGNLYVNVHSAAHPGGELRAQLK